MVFDYEKERREAIEAGQRALDSLRNAAEQLNSAKNWGIVDIFGGGLISTIAKRSKMERAQHYMNEAKKDLQMFRKELQDTDIAANLNVQTGDFLTFADYFFDGVIADWLVQDKINQAKSQVHEAIRRVEGIVLQLK